MPKAMLITIGTGEGVENGIAFSIDLEKLPVNLREKYSQMKETKGKLRIAQEKGYTLLAEMGEELGQVFLNNNTKSKRR